MNFVNNYEKSSFSERAAFKNFIKLYNGFKNWEILLTPYDGYDCYDVLLYKIKDGIITNRMFIEIKIRDCIYDTYFLETKKLNSIKKLCESELYFTDDEYKILYLNFTPQGTFIWDCSVIEKENIKVSKQMMNKATMSSRTKKVNKSKYDLPISLAKRWDYIWDEKQLIPHYDEYFNNRVKQTIKSDYRFKDILFGI